MQHKDKQKSSFRVLKAKKLLVFNLLFLIGIILGAVISTYWEVGSAKPPAVTRNSETMNSTEASSNSLKKSTEPSLRTENSNIPDMSNVMPSQNTIPSTKINAFPRKRVNVLLVGVDRRPGEISLSNTDTLLVASINTDTGKVALLSIPRDTQVMIPGGGKNKINAAARIGHGLKTTTELIEGLMGQPIDGYILTNFSGFKDIIDTLGGITITVEKDMHYNTGDKNDGAINLAKGTQRLNGTQALQYARFRQDALADISRTARQQKILKALESEALQIKTIPKLPWLLPKLSKAVETNLSINQIWSLSNTLIRSEKTEIPSQTLPGNFLTEKGISYWKVNTQETRAVVKKLFEQGKTTSVFFPAGGFVDK